MVHTFYHFLSCKIISSSRNLSKNTLAQDLLVPPDNLQRTSEGYLFTIGVNWALVDLLVPLFTIIGLEVTAFCDSGKQCQIPSLPNLAK